MYTCTRVCVCMAIYTHTHTSFVHVYIDGQGMGALTGNIGISHLSSRTSAEHKTDRSRNNTWACSLGNGTTGGKGAVRGQRLLLGVEKTSNALLFAFSLSAFPSPPVMLFAFN